MQILELLAASFSLFIFYSWALIPIGSLAARFLSPDAKSSFRRVLAPGLGLVILSAVYIVLRFAFGQGGLLLGSLWVFLTLSTLIFFWRGAHREFLCREFGYLSLAFFSYYCFALFSVAPPFGELRDVSSELLRAITGLAIDNLIPYNFARYLVEEIPFSALEVVPTWGAFSRGPLASLGTAAIYTLLGIKETGHWLETSGGVYFVFQSFLIYLNALSLPLLLSLARRMFGPAASAYCLLLLASSYFYFVNVIFTWPKMLMAYFIVLAFVLLLVEQGRRRFAATGILFAAAILAHEIAWFYIFSGSLVFFFQALSSRAVIRALGLRAKQLCLAFCAGALLLSPWFILKSAQNLEPNRIVYLNIFCLKAKDLTGLTLSGALRSYLADNSFREILSVKLDNLLYPFNLLHPLEGVLKEFPNPLGIISSYNHLVFYQLVFALGPPLVFLLVLGVLRGKSLVGAPPKVSLLLAGLLALLPAVVLFGCPLSTWNHVWVYPAFLLLVFCASGISAAGGFFIKLLFILSFIHNVFTFLFSFWFSGPSSLFVHSSRIYLFSQFALILWLFALAYLIASDKKGEVRVAADE